MRPGITYKKISCYMHDSRSSISNTHVPRQVNTSLHESTRINTSQHKPDTNQNESTQFQHEST